MVGPNLNSATAAGKHTKKLIPRSQPKSSMAFGPDPATNHHGDNKTEAILGFVPKTEYISSRS